MILACHNFKMYLLPKKFYVLTTSNRLSDVVHDLKPNKRILKWTVELQAYNFKFNVDHSMKAHLTDIVVHKGGEVPSYPRVDNATHEEEVDIDDAHHYCIDTTYISTLSHESLAHYGIVYNMKYSVGCLGGMIRGNHSAKWQVACTLYFSVQRLVQRPRKEGERAFVAAKDTDLDEAENSLKEGISFMLEKISVIQKKLMQSQLDEKSVQSLLQKRKLELKKDEERLATFMNVSFMKKPRTQITLLLMIFLKQRPAYMDEYEVLQKELQGLFSLYVERFRNLQWLEAQLEGFHAVEQQKHEEVQHRMRSLQRRFHEEELKFLQGADMVSFLNENEGSDIGDYEHRTAEFDKCYLEPQTWGSFQAVNSLKADGAMDFGSSGTPSLDQEGDDNESDNEFDFEVVHRPRSQHAVADYLSRLNSSEPPIGIAAEFLDASLFLIGVVADEVPLEQSTRMIPSIPWTWYEEMLHFLDSGDMPAFLSHHQRRRMTIRSQNFEKVMEKLYYHIVADVLLRCVLPQEQEFVLEEVHTGIAGGHFAALITARKVRQAGYWWSTLLQDARDYVQNCDVCQRLGQPSKMSRMPLQQVLPLEPFQKWRLDFIGPFKRAAATTRVGYGEDVGLRQRAEGGLKGRSKGHGDSGREVRTCSKFWTKAMVGGSLWLLMVLVGSQGYNY
ncbi:hypothetical protein L7F22_008102 [Adiantum nelumboides]|nr:hypothetical protein [Adiantum nelumboides]